MTLQVYSEFECQKKRWVNIGLIRPAHTGLIARNSQRTESLRTRVSRSSMLAQGPVNAQRLQPMDQRQVAGHTPEEA